MSDPKKSTIRNLPSWMGSQDNASQPQEKKPTDVSVNEDRNVGGSSTTSRECEKASDNQNPSKENGNRRRKSESGQEIASFSRLMEGVVFALSGFVNPERGMLRTQALEMGAEYQPDWNSKCTLLICAFTNTPKFRQVKTECGTIVSKEWISECYVQKKLVDIESYLMHAGQPWKKQNILDEPKEDQKSSANREPQLLTDRHSHPNHAASSSSKSGTANPAVDYFSPSKLKKWAVDDLSKTVTWLDSQEEKPEESEIKKIAAEGILTCIQDAINSLEKKEDMHQVVEQWNFLPRVVEELVKLEKGGKNALSFPKEELHKQAIICKKIYEEEFKIVEDDPAVRKRKQIKTDENNTNQKRRNSTSNDAQGYDSDETIDMTEEEIEHGYNTVASKLCK